MSIASAEIDGVLYLVSTPIGNLKDITLRALDVLSSVDLIAAEDTRHASILLNHYNIRSKRTSYFDFNKEKKTPVLIEQLKQGKSIAIISDAGTPGISDPAYHIVNAAIAEGIKIETIPGATALIPALIISGLPTDRFVFEGFLPHKKGRQKRFQELAEEKRTIIIYESPNRIAKTLSDMFQAFGDRSVCIVRELTKKFETIHRGSLKQMIDQIDSIKQKGEFVIVVNGQTR